MGNNKVQLPVGLHFLNQVIPQIGSACCPQSSQNPHPSEGYMLADLAHWFSSAHLVFTSHRGDGSYL